MKPIEPGCKALVVGAATYHDRIGKECHVVYWDGSVNRWLCQFQDSQNVYGFRERHLLRIDGGDDESLETERDREMEACSS